MLRSRRPSKAVRTRWGLLPVVCRVEMGNPLDLLVLSREGMTPIHNPLWFLLSESLDSFPLPELGHSIATEHQQAKDFMLHRKLSGPCVQNPNSFDKWLLVAEGDLQRPVLVRLRFPSTARCLSAPWPLEV